MKQRNLFKSRLKCWPSSLVARSGVGNFSGGLVSHKNLADLDSLGRGPRGIIRVGRKICYLVKELIDCFSLRSEFLDDYGVCHET